MLTIKASQTGAEAEAACLLYVTTRVVTQNGSSSAQVKTDQHIWALYLAIGLNISPYTAQDLLIQFKHIDVY